MTNTSTPVNIAERFTRFTERWSPKTIAEANGWHVKLVKADGEFVWHDHADTDEIFLVVSGRLVIRLQERPDAELGPGELFVVPRGVRHQPVAESCEMMLLEPVGVPNTGEVDSELAATDEWL
ncbi:MAG: cupin domain-containing protein [Jiangellaceae bacterium]